MPKRKLEKANVADRRIFLSSIEDQPSINLSEARTLLRGVTEPKKQAFILALSQCGSRVRACEAVKISTVAAYNWVHEDPAFAEAFKRAMEIASDRMEDEMVRRGCEGVMEPVFQGGKLVGAVRRYSDTLLIFSLKGKKPEIYGDKLRHEGSIDLIARLRAGRERALGRGGEESSDE